MTEERSEERMRGDVTVSCVNVFLRIRPAAATRISGSLSVRLQTITKILLRCYAYSIYGRDCKRLTTDILHESVFFLSVSLMENQDTPRSMAVVLVRLSLPFLWVRSLCFPLPIFPEQACFC